MPRRRTLTPRTERRKRLAIAANQSPNRKRVRLAAQRESARRRRRDNALTRRDELIDMRRRIRTPDEDCGTSRIDPDDPQILSTPSTEEEALQRNTESEIQRRQAEGRLPRTYCIARLKRNDCDVPEPHDVGSLNVICQFCSAKLFRGESSTLCCHKGKVAIPDIVVPPPLRDLIERNDAETKKYLDNIRSLNSAFAFASVQLNSLPVPGRGPCVKINGQVYHCASSLLPTQGHLPPYACLFFLDCNEALEEPGNTGCDPILVNTLETLIEDCNPYSTLFKSVKDTSENAQVMHLNLITDNDPVRNEVAAVFVSNDGAPPTKYTFVLRYRDSGALTTITNLNPHSDPMCYPLLFPCGDSGWTPSMRHVDVHRTAIRQGTTHLQHAGYRLALRGDFSLLHASGKLFQQYVIDTYCKIEGSRIAYIKTHQKQLRPDTHAGTVDFLHSEAHQRGLMGGVPAVLPSSFVGSPRYMLQNYQDSMAIVGRFGKPDILLTITCNPEWPEITAQLKPYERAEHRPDLIARVFHLKVKGIVSEITMRQIFGVVIAHVQVVEFQKGGVPHVHVLFILREEDKFRDPAQVNAIICAEIPDKERNPRLYEVIAKTMVHGPCGELQRHAPCMRNNACSKNYPKPFANETIVNADGYPVYRRRNEGRTITLNNVVLDNRWIIPYNPYLSLKYETPINLEICSSAQSVRFMYKHIYKGEDCAALRLSNTSEGPKVDLDDSDIYLNCRYVGPPEAIWRLHERKLYESSHYVVRLPVHHQFEFEESLYFQPGREEEATAERETKLTGFFKLCRHSEIARQYRYHQIPDNYVWDKNAWTLRYREYKTIGRLYTVNPADRERFFLRLLLLHVVGPTGFRELRTVNGNECATFEEAAAMLHLTDTDQEWHHCLDEASNFQMPSQLRELFATICLFCSPSNVLQLWEAFRQPLIEDFLTTFDLQTSINMALNQLDETFQPHGKNCEAFGLLTPTHLPQTTDAYNEDVERVNGQEAYKQLNPEQKSIADQVLDAIQSNQPKQIFVDGPGGSGKTFLCRTLCHILRGQGMTVLPVAWTEIAAKRLPGGRAAHCVFGLPVPVLDSSVSSISPQSLQATKLRDAALIIWDEISVVPKQALQVVHNLLTAIMGNTLPFGGKVVVFGGDFRQGLPDVRGGGRTEIVEANVKRAAVWASVLSRKLTTNMRSTNEDFSSFILQMGNGDLIPYQQFCNDTIRIPKTYHRDYLHFIRFVFGIDPITADNVARIHRSSILCTKDEDCDKINDHLIQNIVPGDLRTYLSCDSAMQEGVDEQLYPPEFLHSITPSGLPPHKLQLKVNALVMLIRNLNPKKGLVNGARLVVKDMQEFTMTCVLIDSGETVIIPRMDLTHTNHNLPYHLKRRQFPIKVAFAIPINKAQGHTLDKAGLYLPDPVFTHGQLYHAFSRVRRSDHFALHIATNEKQEVGRNHVYTSNVVFKEVL